MTKKRRERSAIIKASRYTQATKGYLVFHGSYPHTTVKYFKTKSAAQRFRARQLAKDKR